MHKYTIFAVTIKFYQFDVWYFHFIDNLLQYIAVIVTPIITCSCEIIITATFIMILDTFCSSYISHISQRYLINYRGISSVDITQNR